MLLLKQQKQGFAGMTAKVATAGMAAIAIVAMMIYPAFAQVSISDTGVGIETKDIPLLFDKFNRIDNPLTHKVAGSGLGLYWVEKVIGLHQGQIDVESKINNGTTFTVSVPRGM